MGLMGLMGFMGIMGIMGLTNMAHITDQYGPYYYAINLKKGSSECLFYIIKNRKSALFNEI